MLPILNDRTTIELLWALKLGEKGTADVLERVRERHAEILASEDVVLGRVGSDLRERLFRGYTRKQWGLDLSRRSAGVAGRLPTRSNDDDRYLTDSIQAMPEHGYTPMLARMLDHPDIALALAADCRELTTRIRSCHVVHTGPIDDYHGFCSDELPYHSMRFEYEQRNG